MDVTFGFSLLFSLGSAVGWLATVSVCGSSSTSNILFLKSGWNCKGAGVKIPALVGSGKTLPKLEAESVSHYTFCLLGEWQTINDNLNSQRSPTILNGIVLYSRAKVLVVYFSLQI